MHGERPPECSVSAVVVSYRTGPVLVDCLAVLGQQVGMNEIILVDNGNPDGAIVRATAAVKSIPVKILSGHGNIGFAAACNMGAAAARNRYLLFINPDAIMPLGGVDMFLSHAKSLARPWLIGAMLLNEHGVEQPGGRRLELTPMRAMVEFSGLYRLSSRMLQKRRFNLHQAPCPDHIIEAETISGGLFFCVGCRLCAYRWYG